MKQKWLVTQVFDGMLESYLNECEDNGYDIISITPRPKTDRFGVEHFCVVARLKDSDQAEYDSIFSEVEEFIKRL